MGEAADDILEGRVCQYCGEWFHDDEDEGYPRSCEGCADEDDGCTCDTAGPSRCGVHDESDERQKPRDNSVLTTN